jgi:hypothetical protein
MFYFVSLATVIFNDSYNINLNVIIIDSQTVTYTIKLFLWRYKLLRFYTY